MATETKEATPAHIYSVLDQVSRAMRPATTVLTDMENGGKSPQSRVIEAAVNFISQCAPEANRSDAFFEANSLAEGLLGAFSLQIPLAKNIFEKGNSTTFSGIFKNIAGAEQFWHLSIGYRFQSVGSDPTQLPYFSVRTFTEGLDPKHPNDNLRRSITCVMRPDFLLNLGWSLDVRSDVAELINTKWKLLSPSSVM